MPNLLLFAIIIWYIVNQDTQKMTRQNIITILKKYQKSSEKKRRQFLRAFEEKMIYRTTKTENPETTHKMVRDVLDKLARKI